MGIFSDLLTSAQGIDVTPDITALDRIVVRELEAMVDRGDVDLPTALAETDAVHTLPQYTVDHTGGNFTLTFVLRNGETFTTGNLAHNADASTIETAIDSAATTASITGWTNGDITVTGGTLLAAGADVVLTYDGASVSGDNHTLVVLNDSLTGGTTASPSSVKTTAGQTDRKAWAALQMLGAVAASDVPAQGVDPSAFTAPTNKGTNFYFPSEATLRALAEEAAIEDLNDNVRVEILAASSLV